jgi:hypothetical protein
MTLDHQDLEMLAGLADKLVSEILTQDDIRVLAVDATNPNAVSILLGKDGGVPVPDRLRELLTRALIFGVVPAERGSWVSFFPAEREDVKIETNAQGGE